MTRHYRVPTGIAAFFVAIAFWALTTQFDCNYSQTIVLYLLLSIFLLYVILYG